jgi:hypothetical protein
VSVISAQAEDANFLNVRSFDSEWPPMRALNGGFGSTALTRPAAAPGHFRSFDPEKFHPQSGRSASFLPCCTPVPRDWTLCQLPDGLGDVALGAGTQEGLGDITQQFYFSPKKPTGGGWIWGAGPQILLPAGASKLTAGKWGVGPTAVALKQENGWTYGVLVNQIWSASSHSYKNDYSVFYVQPFLAYTTKTYTTAGINTESTYNWKASQWSVPVNLTLTQILKVVPQALSLQVGVRYWAVTPEGVGPKHWGYRFQLTFLFPKAK